MLARIKALSDERFANVGKALYRIGLTPNRITVLGLIFTGVAAWFLLQEEIYLAILMILIGGLADGLDGLVARSTGNTTDWGGFLDALVDRYSDILLIGALLLSGWLEPVGGNEWIGWIGDISGEGWALGALSGALLTSYVRAAAERLGVKQAGVGLIERQERMVILMLCLLVGQVTVALVLLTILGHFTVVQRAHHFWQHSQDTKSRDNINEDKNIEPEGKEVNSKNLECREMKSIEPEDRVMLGTKLEDKAMKDTIFEEKIDGNTKSEDKG